MLIKILTCTFFVRFSVKTLNRINLFQINTTPDYVLPSNKHCIWDERVNKCCPRISTAAPI